MRDGRRFGGRRTRMSCRRPRRQGQRDRPRLALDPRRLWVRAVIQSRRPPTSSRSCSSRKSPTTQRTSRSLIRWSPRCWPSLNALTSVNCPRGGRGRRLLHEQHMAEVIAKHIPADPARQGQPPRRGAGSGGATPGATRPGDRTRPAGLPKTQTNGRAAVRSHQTQRGVNRFTREAGPRCVRSGDY